MIVHYSEMGIWFETHWNNKDGFHPLINSTQFSPTSINSPLDSENTFEKKFDAYFLSNLKTRDKIGCELLKEVTRYSLTREMLREIYNQADSPEFEGLETHGSLYANSQEIKN